MLYEKMPEGFDPRFEVASCFIEHDGEILLLHRHEHKPEGDTWGVPAGKISGGEKPLDTVVREIMEETGLNIPASHILYFGRVCVRYPTYDFIYHIFHTRLDEKQVVKITPSEHKDFRWVSPNNALNLLLIQDLDACIKLFYRIGSNHSV